MLVDFVIESIHGGIGQNRAQPIAMTTIAMIAGMRRAANSAPRRRTR
jgi:hypothetical protein